METVVDLAKTSPANTFVCHIFLNNLLCIFHFKDWFLNLTKTRAKHLSSNTAVPWSPFDAVTLSLLLWLPQALHRL